MQALVRGTRSFRGFLRPDAIQKHLIAKDGVETSRLRCVISSTPLEMQEKGIENLTVADVLMTKRSDEQEQVGSWLWCRTTDIVYDAIQNMAKHNIGSLVVLKPGDQQHIAGIVTERDYLRKIIGQGRSPKHTRVGEIMTDETQLITISSGTNILHAMQLMSENHIRHVPVIDGKIVGMISMVDAVRTVVEQNRGEVKRLNDFIKGDYY